MSDPIGVDLLTGRIVTRDDCAPSRWMMLRGYTELPATEDAQRGRIFAEIAHRPSTGSYARDGNAWRKWRTWCRVVHSRRVGRRPLP